MQINMKSLTVFVATAIAQNAWSFDVVTHTAMTAEAIKQSKISATPNTSPILKKLGLYDKESPFGDNYLDLGVPLTRRTKTDFEEKKMVAVRRVIPDLPTSLSIPGWIIRGSVREDDNTVETPQDNPEGDEPGGVFNRVFGHFYDPQNDRPLTVGVALGPRAPDWATVAGAGVGVIGAGRQNHYNLPSAREAMWRALTMTKLLPNGTLETILPGGNNVGAAAHEAERKAYWATTFRAVGDIVHVVQDMAQPQHTRNDGHAGYGCAPYVGCAFGHDSFVEKYFAARTIQARQFTLKEGLVIPSDGKPIDTTAPQLIYGGYLVPSFASASHYFSTATGAGNAAGKGLANYSNRGFFSFGTNIKGSATSPENASNYPLPDSTILTERTLSGGDVLTMTGAPAITGGGYTAEIKFKEGFVNDSITLAADKVKLSSYGLWDQSLQRKGVLLRDYTLNHYNYDDQARLLIPRAVGYSAGLIDYFFRGELKIDLPDEGFYSVIDHADPASNCKDNCGFSKIKLKLTNVTPDIVVSGNGPTVVQNMVGGTAVAVFKYSRNSCYKPDLSGEVGSDDFPNDTAGYSKCLFANGDVVAGKQVEDIVVSQPLTGISLNKGEQKPLIFTFDTPLPINAWNVSLQVVYRGPLGSEADAVVVTTEEISGATYWTVANAMDYWRGCAGKDFATVTEIYSFSNPLYAQRVFRFCAGLPQDCFHVPTAYKLLSSVLQNETYREFAETVRLPVGSFARVAVLGQRDAFNMTLRRSVGTADDQFMAIAYHLGGATATFSDQPYLIAKAANNLSINPSNSAVTANPVKKSRGSYRSEGFLATTSFDSDFPSLPSVTQWFTGYDALPPYANPNPVPLKTLDFANAATPPVAAPMMKTVQSKGVPAVAESRGVSADDRNTP